VGSDSDFLSLVVASAFVFHLSLLLSFAFTVSPLLSDCYPASLLRSYSKQRKAFDKPISTLYAIQEKLAKMSVKIDASRLLIHKAAMLKDSNQPFIKDAAQAKLFASEAATFCSHQAIQVSLDLLVSQTHL
jgi:hypothetical protein